MAIIPRQLTKGSNVWRSSSKLREYQKANLALFLSPANDFPLHCAP
jgi:hypothetical protein